VAGSYAVPRRSEDRSRKSDVRKRQRSEDRGQRIEVRRLNLMPVENVFESVLSTGDMKMTDVSKAMELLELEEKWLELFDVTDPFPTCSWRDTCR
jgi:hypothetical protein